MSQLIINSGNKNVRSQLEELGSKADQIKIAVAFFSNAELIKDWNRASKKVTLIVSFRPPTSYYCLKEIQTSLNVDTFFLGDEFHSKFWIFYKNRVPFAAVLGSSNFSDGGLKNNTEANLLMEDKTTLNLLDAHFENDLLPTADRLQPSDIDAYKDVYLNYLKSKASTKKEVLTLRNQIHGGGIRNKNVKPCKEARQYFTFWRVVNEIRDIVKPISDRHFPGEPYYLVLDHYWHWVKAIWYKQYEKTVNPAKQKEVIPKLFMQYVKWRKKEANASYPKWMLSQSKAVFKKYLSPSNINKLTKDQAVEVYRSLHSSAMPIQRFSSDYTFIKWNDVKKIRTSLNYLLHSHDSMDIRIHNLLKNRNYKLHKLASSGVQEINGWMFPEKFPIRNDKADRAVAILGYDLNNLK